MLEAVEGELCLLEALEVPQVMRCVLLCMLEVSEVMHCVLRMLEAVDCGLCLLEVPEMMRRVLALYARGRGGCALFGGFETPSTPTDRETTDGGELEDAGG